MSVTSRPNNGLPVEIWTMILNAVVEDELLSFNFAQFLLDWRSNRLKLDTEWKKLRLVCHTWYDILDRIDGRWSTPHLEVSNYAELVGSSGVKSLHAYDKRSWTTVKVHPYPFDLDLLLAAKNVTTISLTYCSGFGGVVDLLLQNPDYFPNVKSLSLDRVGDPNPHFWAALEKGFPHLVSFRIKGGCHKGVGSVFLPKLKILEMELQSPPLCHFPSLEHLSIPLWLEAEYHQLILQHGRHLKSLFVIGAIDFLQANWTKFPNLKFLGGSKFTFAHINAPPDHPLEHVFLIDPTYNSHLTVPQIMAHFPKLRRITFDRWYMPSLTMLSIRTACWRNKVAYTDIIWKQRVHLSPFQQVKLFLKLVARRASLSIALAVFLPTFLTYKISVTLFHAARMKISLFKDHIRRKIATV